MSFKRILIPTDFSAYADKALELGLRLASGGERELIVCHINQVPDGNDGKSFDDSGLVITLETETRKAFEKLSLRFPQLEKTNHQFLQETGSSIEKLHGIIQSENIDLIVMGTKGRDKSIEAYFGSNTSDMMKHSDASVLAVPEVSNVKSIQRIVLATDFEQSDRTESIKTLSELARTLESEIHIVHIIKNENVSDISLSPSQVMGWAEAMKGIKHQYHFISHSNVKEGVLRFAYENKVGLLAVLDKSHNILNRLFHKSLTERLPYDSRLPILLLKK